MLLKGSVGLLRQALQYGLQQPVQQSCVQLQVLSLQAVRFRSKPSNPKFRGNQTRVQKLDSLMQRALDRTKAAEYAAAAAVPVKPQAFDTPSAQPAAAAAVGPSSQADTESSSSSASSTPSSESGAASSSTTSDSSSSSDTSGWQPSWMRSLRSMIKGDSARRRPRAKPSPLTPVAATTDAKQATQAEERQRELQAQSSQQEDGWARMFATAKDLSLDDYATQLANDPKSDDFDAPPRPMTPVRGPRAYYMNTFDHQRVQYVRFETLHSLIVALSQADKLRIKLNPTLHRDPAAVQQLADATAFPPDVVRDLCENFHRSKREFWLLHAHYTAGGKMPPTDDDGRRMQLIQKLEVEDNQRRAKELLAGRDVKGCQLRKINTDVLLNPKALMKRVCPQTQLTYAQCCGRKSRLNYKATLRAKAAKRVYEAAGM